MKRAWILAASAVVICTALGCVPRRLFWSPDGKHGAIVDEKGLYLCAVDGKLSEPIAPGAQMVAWYPDSKGFVLAQAKAVASWDEAATYLSPERKQKVISLAGPLRQELLAYQGSWDRFQSDTRSQLSGGEFLALLLYIRDQQSEGLAAKLGDDWEQVKALKMPACELFAYTLTEQGAQAGPSLAKLPDMVMDLRVAPNGQTFAASVPVASASAIPLSRLELFSLKPEHAPVIVAEHVAAYFDWSPDGKYLYYGTTRTPPANDKDEFTLGSLSRRAVLGEDGQALSALPDAEDLAGLLFWSMMKVRCLHDGRVLFSSGEVALPATSADMPKQINLFTIDPERQPTVTRLLPREADERLEGLSMGEFELSPDDKRIVVVGQSKNVSVITLATGKIDAVVTAKDSSDSNNLPSMPVWRTAEELVLAVPAGNALGSAGRPEIVLWAPNGEPRCISKDWPELFVKSEDH